MSSLQQQLDARRAAEPVCIKTGSRDSAAFVEFHVSPHSRSGFPWGNSATTRSNRTWVTAATSRPSGSRLLFLRPMSSSSALAWGKLVEAVNDRSLASVMPLDARYTDTLGRQPWVGRVTISRIDKGGGTAG